MKHPKSYDSTAETRKRMSHVKLKKGYEEVVLAKALWHKGYRYRLNYKGLPGSPDIAIIKYKVAIFVDGEFWHGFDWDNYKNDLIQIFNLRAGGLAIYGGVIAGVLTLLVFTRVKKLSFFSMADTGVLGLITGQIIGRWGNFFNCEAFGGYTDSFLAMRIKRSLVNPGMISQELLDHLIVENGVEYIQVHPTFLYESMWNLGVLIFMLWYRKRKKFDGEMLLIYLLGYGLGRSWIEGLRTDQLIFFGTGIPVSQALSMLLVLISGTVLVYKHKQLKKVKKGDVG